MSVATTLNASRDRVIRAALVGFESADAIADGLTARGLRVTSDAPPAHLEEPEARSADVYLVAVDGVPGEIDRLTELTQSDCLVVALSASPNIDEMLRCLARGARAYFDRTIDADRLSLAIRVVASGSIVLPSELGGMAAKDLWGMPIRRKMVIDGREVALTLREWEVVELMRMNLNTSQIARRMYVSPVTVRTHISSIVKKLSVRDRNAALQLLR